MQNVSSSAACLGWIRGRGGEEDEWSERGCYGSGWDEGGGCKGGKWWWWWKVFGAVRGWAVGRGWLVEEGGGVGVGVEGHRCMGCTR